jgi:UPF0755 protein
MVKKQVKHPSRLSTFFLLLFTALCLGGLCLVGVEFSLFQQVERTFGPPDSELGLRQQVYLSALLALQAQDLTLPYNASGQDQHIQIQLNESTFDITQRLEQQGLIASADALRNYLVYSGLDRSVQAGNYTLNPRMTALEIARALQDATPKDVTFSILAGWRVEEIAAALPTSGLNIPRQAFLNATAIIPQGYPALIDLPSHTSLEGFLLPDSYQLSRNLTTDELIAVFLANFERQVGEDLRQAYSKEGLSLYQAVILASLVQREAILEEEMPTIAAVFLNRIAAGMRLESDPTVQYALGYNSDQKTWWKNPLSAADLEIDSPYNTYLNDGFPPGPIANPGLEALRAVAYPADKPELFYFRAACDHSGRHVFSQTYSEHLKNACP